MARGAVPDDVAVDLQSVVGPGRRGHVGARRRRAGSGDRELLPLAHVAVGIEHDIVGDGHVLVGDRHFGADYVGAPAALREKGRALGPVAVARA